MLNFRKGFLLSTIGASLFFSCEKDDLCDGQTATPKVRIELYDKSNSTTLKPAYKVECYVIPEIASDSIKSLVFDNKSEIQLPLDINKLETVWNLRFTEIINNDTLTKTDQVKFVYNPKAEYVSKACGYKSVYFNVVVNREENPSGNWIVNYTQLVKDVINEEKIHAKIYY